MCTSDAYITARVCMCRCDSYVCKGVQGSVCVRVCTSGAYIAAKGCVCACMRVRLSAQ